MEAKRTRHAVDSITYHLVWCPKYRHQVFTGSAAERVDQLIRSKGVELEGKLVALEAQPDPGPLFAGFPPTLAVHQILDRIKGYTSYVLGQAFSWLRHQVASLWKRSYYAGTAGEVSAETMRRYIEAQKGSHVQKDR